MSIILLAMAWHLGRCCLLRISFITYARSSLPPYVTLSTDCLCSTGQCYILALTPRRLTFWSATSALAFIPATLLTSEFVTCILEFEYGFAVVQALSHDSLTLSEHRKPIRRES
ncbi:hypothetical protein DFJ58DRAFT_328392 [Suillus subalutaceus]|uniref:uncharacterized protein n=1 Tax=Suillus subalutaceus TaxID=48586 RepID=UPI001B866551|nr:uncharacterized protein DFJ58DRAFT_328392 [Suillus subalutaceus]KAG1857317.1 hypothetical protein DFJ58DRAFT_328392 [Suillus subalutaceus]